MAKDIVCAECELSIAANNIVEYGDFLARTIETYISVLTEIQEKGIKDELVCSKISSIVQLLKPYQTSILDVCEAIAFDVKDYIEEVEQADKFIFPSDITMTISSIVSRFL